MLLAKFELLTLPYGFFSLIYAVNINILKPSTENLYRIWFPGLSFIRILSSSISKKFEKTIFWTWSGSVLFSLWDPYPGKNVWNWNPEKFLCLVW